MIDPLLTWQSTFASLPKTGDASWALNFADWVYNRVVNIQTDPTVLDSSSGFVFIFNKPLFATQLALLTPSTSILSGVQNFADAWETTILTTIFPATLNVSSGAFKGSPSPSNTFSVVNSVIIDPSSIAAGKAKIMELALSTPVGDPLMSQFPTKFREAFLALTITVTGLDSTPTPAGPLPLTASNVPLI